MNQSPMAFLKFLAQRTYQISRKDVSPKCRISPPNTSRMAVRCSIQVDTKNIRFSQFNYLSAGPLSRPFGAPTAMILPINSESRTCMLDATVHRTMYGQCYGINSAYRSDEAAPFRIVAVAFIQHNLLKRQQGIAFRSRTRRMYFKCYSGSGD